MDLAHVRGKGITRIARRNQDGELRKYLETGGLGDGSACLTAQPFFNQTPDFSSLRRPSNAVHHAQMRLLTSSPKTNPIRHIYIARYWRCFNFQVTHAKETACKN